MASPLLERIGPFTYTEVQNKNNISWNPGRSEVTYLIEPSYIFYNVSCPANTSSQFSVDELCSMPTNLNITTVNSPLLYVIEQVLYYEQLNRIEEWGVKRIIEYVDKNFAEGIVTCIFSYNNAAHRVRLLLGVGGSGYFFHPVFRLLHILYCDIVPCCTPFTV